jgi:hypothetical protein
MHVRRHTFGHDRLSGRAGGNVMRTTGWRSRSLLERYAASAAEHAIAAPRSPSPTDRL